MNLFRKYFTEARLKRYSVFGEEKTDKTYLYNILLSKELYPLIAVFEVSFRNNINKAINENIKSQWLLDKKFVATFLQSREFDMYNQVYNDLKSKNKLTEGRLVAGLNLGFWVNLFDKRYRVSIWHRKGMFESIFENFNISVPNRISYVYPILKEIQFIRNRISHQESIFDYKNGLDNFHANLIKSLEWINEDLKNEAVKLSQFDKNWSLL